MTVKDIKAKASEMELNQACEWLNSIKRDYGVGVTKIADIYNRKFEKYNNELKRLDNMHYYENIELSKGYQIIGGMDEAGRGPLAGPVVAACAILPKDEIFIGLNDSKKVPEKTREKLYKEIKEKAISYGIGIVNASYIDEVNILNATKKAMALAVEYMKIKPEVLLMDALTVEDIKIRQIPIVKGDSKSVSIAAASILAKVTRDAIIRKEHEHYPQYGFERNKGYGTKEHIDAIKRYGICPIHRRTFTKNFINY